MTDDARARAGQTGPRPAARFVHRCPLRWSDLDAYGHVNNSRVLTLYEEARVALFFLGGPAEGVGSFAEGIVVARHEVDYLRPIGYVGRGPGVPPEVRVELWVEDLRPSRCTVAYELYDGDALAGRARTVLVPYDLARQSSRRMTEAERAFLERYLLPPAAGAGETAPPAGGARENAGGGAPANGPVRTRDGAAPGQAAPRPR